MTNHKLIQYNKMVKELNVHPADAAKALGMELEQVNVMADVDSKQSFTIEELAEKYRGEALEVLVTIMRGHVPDTRPADMLAAAKIIYTGEGKLPENASNAMASRLARMKLAKENIINTNGTGNIQPVIDLIAA